MLTPHFLLEGSTNIFLFLSTKKKNSLYIPQHLKLGAYSTKIKKIKNKSANLQQQTDCVCVCACTLLFPRAKIDFLQKSRKALQKF